MHLYIEIYTTCINIVKLICVIPFYAISSLVFWSFFKILFSFYYFIVILLQLYQFSPLCPPLHIPLPAPMVNSHTIICVHGSLIDFINLFLESAGEREKEENIVCKRNISYLPFVHPQPWTWSATRACALSRN